jgi:tetratricopeptide (TPR) repeat protein
MKFKKLYIVFLFAIITMKTFIGFSQEYTYASTLPSTSAATGKKFSSIALASDGRVFMLDELTKAVFVYDNTGIQLEKITSFKTDAGELLLTKPTAICLDAQDQLYVYDDALGKVIKRPLREAPFAFGEKGSSLGQISNVRSLAADSKGYCYVLNGSSKQVDIFYPDGNYLTWINGTNVPFGELVAIGVNGADELVVLDKSGPHVFMFDVTGTLVNTNRSLGSKKNFKLEKATDMAVLQNGDFIILDESACQGIHFNRIGNVLGNIGGKGATVANGVFRNATMIRANPKTPADICIFDAFTQQVQCFTQKNATAALKNAPKRLKMVNATTSRKPVFDLVVAPNQYRYVIPADDRKKVIAYKDTSNIDIFTITGKIEDAVSIDVDSASNLYVADRGADEILMFDIQGALIRKFGKDIPDKLKDPSGIVVQKSGNIVVADKARGALYMWNSQGVFKKIITSPENSVLTSPVRLQRDSKDQLYVLDGEANCIYRIGSGGWPTAEKILQARSPKPGDKPGIISNFFIDPLDQIHVYNETTHQIEIYAWDFEPQMKFSIGRPGSGINGFEDIDRMLLDTQNLYIYLTSKKGTTQKVYQYLVAPPMPEGSVTYDVVDGKLNVYFAKSKSNAVVAYGLLSKNASGEKIAFRTTGSSFVVTQDPEDTELHHYDFVTMSWSDYSEPSNGFDDYFNYAESMVHAQRYEEALGAWQIALEKMGKSQRMNEHVAKRLSDLSFRLAGSYDVSNAVAYAKTAQALLPKSEMTQAALGHALKAQYRQYAYRNEIDALLVDAESMMSKDILKPLVLGVLDSVGRILALEENLSSINNAIKIQKKVLSWDAGNPMWNASMAASYHELFKYKFVREASSLELSTILEELRANAGIAYTGLKTAKKPYFQTHLILLEGYNLSGRYAETEKQATAELGASSSAMSKTDVIEYRKKLADAFMAQGKYGNAISEYNTILAGAPDNRMVSELLANALIEEEEFDQAKNVLQQLTIGNTDNSHYMIMIGEAELRKGNYTEAIFQLEKAIRQSPSSLEAYGHLAEAFDLNGSSDKALDFYEVAIRNLDQDIKRLEQQSILKKELNQKKLVREKYLVASARIYAAKQQHNAARQSFVRATTLNPNNANAQFGLGESCEKLNRIFEAMDAYNKALSLDENNEKFIGAYLNSVKLRDKALKNELPLSIVAIEPEAIYPSLYKNYSVNKNLPVASLTLSNNSSSPIQVSEIRTFIGGLMNQATKVNGSEIAAYSNQEIRLSAILNDEVLQTSEEKNVQLEIEVDYIAGTKTSTLKQSAPAVLRNRNAIIWKDKRRLSSFVSTNDEPLIDFNKLADQVFRSAPTFGMNPTIIKAMQVYVLLNQSSLTYSNDPNQSYSTLSVHSDILDYLQYPLETMKRGGGDCDDLVALTGAMLENGGISAAYIDMPGHVMLAFDCKIKPVDIRSAGLTPEEVIIIGDRVWIPLETTLLGSKNFFTSWKMGAERFYKELQDGKFPEVIPFADAWQIYQPTAFHPEGYTPKLPEKEALLNSYELMVSQLVAKTKKESINELASRYQSEQDNNYVKNAYGTLLAQTGDLMTARSVFQDALKITQDDASALNNLGNTYLMESKYDQAISYYEQAAALDEQDAMILINLCKAFLGKGDKPNAKIYFQKAESIDQEITETFLDLKTQIQ